MKPSRIALAAAAAVTLVTSLVRTDANLKPLATPTFSGGYTPAQLRTAHGLNSATGSTVVAVVDAYANPNAAADLTAHRNLFGGPISTVTGNTGWGQEEMLDLEMVSAICPACPILYVGANSASFNDLATAVNYAATYGAKVISNSYGGSESGSETNLATAYDHAGVTITVSSGDSGYGAQAPAAFRTVTAVGGTHLVLDGSGNRTSETVWSGAGSGCSAYISKPAWQPTGSYGGNNWYVFGGTSVAAPIIGGVYALSGSNGRCTRGKNTAGAYLCKGVDGYDGPSGMGTPIGTGAFYSSQLHQRDRSEPSGRSRCTPSGG